MQEKLANLLREAKRRIVILGTNPLSPALEECGQLLADLLVLHQSLSVTVLYESDSENFQQALARAAGEGTGRRLNYAALSVHRDRISGVGFARDEGLLDDIGRAVSDPALRADVLARVTLRQSNLRMPVNVLQVDEQLLWSFTLDTPPDLDDYTEAPADSPLGRRLLDYLEFLAEPEGGGRYLSRPAEELIQLYDKQRYPRGIFPRRSFYTTEYQRYSVWGFAFNRRGKLLLHRRSDHVKDNRGLWDKSMGGHVDLRDSSSAVTAQRELVEELFLPDAEFTKYMRADLGDILNFGDWTPKKRPEKHFRDAFAGIGPSDWIMFRATDEDGDPLTVSRVSERTLKEVGGESMRRTMFLSDVYFFIAPPDYMETEEEMRKLVALAEETGAAADHRLISVGELDDWIESCEKTGTASEVFTDDLLHIRLEHLAMLERFAEFLTYVFQSPGSGLEPPVVPGRV